MTSSFAYGRASLGLENVKRYLAHADVQQAIEEMEEHLYTRGEKRYAALFLKTLDAVEILLEGKPMPKGYERPSLRAVELVWAAHGRLPRGRDGEAHQTNIVNQPLIMDRQDAQAAMSLLRQERDRLRREREIARDPNQIERSSGERNGP